MRLIYTWLCIRSQCTLQGKTQCMCICFYRHNVVSRQLAFQSRIRAPWVCTDSTSGIDPAIVYILSRHAILGNDDNILCPVMIVPINALRHSNVKGGNTIEYVLAHAATHPLQRTEWVNPDLPVISHVTVAHTVSRDKPMETSSASMIFKLITTIFDYNVFIRSHDLRYGTAEDLLNIVRDQHMRLLDISEELNHNSASANGKLTKRYTKKHST
jgi:hypothetical protein